MRSFSLCLRAAALSGALVFSPAAAAPVPAPPYVVSVDATQGSIHITWYVTGWDMRISAVYRRTADTEWVVIGSPKPTGPTFLSFDDTSAGPGILYSYRLAMGRSPDEVFSETVSAGLPASDIRFAIDAIQQNPAVGRVGFTLSVPSAAPALGELFDVQGRRIASRDLSALGPGQHLVYLGDEQRLRGGVYFVRVVWNGQKQKGRVVLLN